MDEIGDFVGFLQRILNAEENFDGYGTKGQAAWALGMLGHRAEAAVEDLIAMLQDGEQDTVVESLTALGRIALNMLSIEEYRSPHRLLVLSAAAQCLRSPSVRVQREAASLIRCSDSDAVHVITAIIEALDEVRDEVAESLAKALARIGPDAAKAIPALQAAAVAGRLDQAVLLDTLQQMNKPHDDELEGEFDEDDDHEAGEEWKNGPPPDEHPE